MDYSLFFYSIFYHAKNKIKINCNFYVPLLSCQYTNYYTGRKMVKLLRKCPLIKTTFNKLALVVLVWLSYFISCQGPKKVK